MVKKIEIQKHIFDSLKIGEFGIVSLYKYRGRYFIKVIELWRPVFAYEQYYEVSSFGRIRTLPRFIDYRRWDSSATQRLLKSKFLHSSFNKGNGYLYTGLNNGMKGRSMSIHRIVALSFLPNQFNYKEVNHKDCNKLNNYLFNLEWCSPTQNNRHARKNGRMRHNPLKGEQHHKSILNNAAVIDIRSSEVETVHLAMKYNVSVCTISAVRRKATWKHI